jgi:ubiquinone/menaquinone biosynthesis C-methylase UbiE
MQQIPGASPPVPSSTPDQRAEFAAQSDVWSRWLLKQRSGGHLELEKAQRKTVERFADWVIDGACIKPGMLVVDLGSGDGLVPFRAISRVGPELRMVLTDVSEPLLNHAKSRAAQLGYAAQCQFIHCSADDLHPLASSTADAVTCRSVLSYVADKKAALQESFRVLKPGGRLSIAEPIFQDDALSLCALRQDLDSKAESQRNPLKVLMHRWKSAQWPDTIEAIATNPVTSFNERNLFDLAQSLGFEDIHLQLRIDQTKSELADWDSWLDISPMPGTPTLREILSTRFSASDRAHFEALLRPVVEAGQMPVQERMAYLQATRPASVD